MGHINSNEMSTKFSRITAASLAQRTLQNRNQMPQVTTDSTDMEIECAARAGNVYAAKILAWGRDCKFLHQPERPSSGNLIVNNFTVEKMKEQEERNRRLSAELDQYGNPKSHE